MGQSALALERNSKDWTAVHFYRSSLRMHCLPTSAGRHRKMSTGRNKKPPAKPDRYLRGGIYWVNLPTQNIGEVTDGKQRTSVVTQNRPMRVTSKPANEKARDIDSDGSPYRLLRYEQCLERSEETTSFGTREARMALAAHRASHWCTSRNSRRLPEGGGDRGTTTGWLGTASTGKTGQRGDHRPRCGKSSRR